MAKWVQLALIVALVLGGACKRERAGQTSAGPSPGQAQTEPTATVVVPPPSYPGCAIAERDLRRTAPGRLIAVGDVHGDLAAARRALRAAGAIDERDRWVGGNLTVVQTGDVLDRGDDEQAIIDLFESLEGQAAAAGGAFVWLLGNHELMNAAGDFRYVTPGGYRDFEDVAGLDVTRTDNAETAELIRQAPKHMRARAAALFPGGPYATILSGQDVVTIVGDAVFSHAGVTAAFTDRIAEHNRHTRCWLGGTGPMPEWIVAAEGPVWTRQWGGARPDCHALNEVLTVLGVSRMVVGHTPQRSGITSACNGKLLRIDTGMAAHYGGRVEVLELSDKGKAAARKAPSGRLRPL